MKITHFFSHSFSLWVSQSQFPTTRYQHARSSREEEKKVCLPSILWLMPFSAFLAAIVIAAFAISSVARRVVTIIASIPMTSTGLRLVAAAATPGDRSFSTEGGGGDHQP